MLKISINNIEATTSKFTVVKQEVEQKMSDLVQPLIEKDVKIETLEQKMKERNCIVFGNQEEWLESLENGYSNYLKKDGHNLL